VLWLHRWHRQQRVLSDEAVSHILGKVRYHNCHFRGSQSCHDVREQEQDSPKLNVWCGSTSVGAVLPWKPVTVAAYLDMLENCAVPQAPVGYIFQQIGQTPPHFPTPVIELIPQWAIHRNVDWARWLPQVPDMTRLDFFLWGHIRNEYWTKVNGLSDLCHMISDAVESVTPEILRHTWKEVEYWLDVCHARKGVYIEFCWHDKIFGELLHIFISNNLHVSSLGVMWFTLSIICVLILDTLYSRTCCCVVAVTCLQCGGVSTTFQHCQDLLLDIRRASTLDDALAAYFCRERLDGDDAYRCERCHRKVSATKKFSLEKPPQVLCIQFKRYIILISEIIHLTTVYFKDHITYFWTSFKCCAPIWCSFKALWFFCEPVNI
jgi:hypothetical protein